MSIARFRIAAVSALAALAAGCGAAPYYVSSSPKVFLPQQAVGPRPTGMRTVMPDESLFTTPVGWRSAATLSGTASGSVVSKEFVFEQGETLAVATITGTAASGFSKGTIALCGTPRVDTAKTLLAASTLGVTSLFNRTGASWQVRLLDTDGDARLEQAILAGVKSEKDAAPVAIEPVSYRLVTNAVMPGESDARIVYRGKTGLVGGHVSFDLQVTESGQSLVFTNVRTQVDLEDLPQRVSLMGTEFTVRSYDPANGSAEIEVHRGFVPATYGLETRYTTQYIPIYMPR